MSGHGHAGGHAHGEQRVSAEREEVGVAAHAPLSERVGPDRREQFLFDRLRRLVLAPWRGEWRERFREAWPRISPLGFDERFKRLWEYYLCYCEAGFEEGSINVGFYTLKHADG